MFFFKEIQLISISSLTSKFSWTSNDMFKNLSLFTSGFTVKIIGFTRDEFAVVEDESFTDIDFEVLIVVVLLC